MYNPTKPYKHTILKLIESTWHTPYVQVTKGLYPVIQKKFLYPEVQHTDGIGSKGLYHWQKRTFRNAVIDALAMNLNDLAMVGAIPYAVQNHIVLPTDDHGVILAIVEALAAECKKRKIAMTGGETSIQSDYTGMDISITVSGLIKKKFKNECKVGDVLIGLKSNGLHSNGMTKVREVFGTRSRKEFTEPTHIYLDEIHRLLKKCRVHGMMHITGGAFTKLKDILPRGEIHISVPQKLKPQLIFRQLFSRGVSNREMYTTFNCGIGYIISVAKKDERKALKLLPGSEKIGEVLPGQKKRVVILSAFDGRTIVV